VGNAVAARQVVLAAMEAAGLMDQHESHLFGDVDLDFNVYVADRLPFAAHRFGMAAITLCGAVYLCRSSLEFEATELLVLLRHEAEHVRQQRARPRSFYLRYVWDWLIDFVGNLVQRRSGPADRHPGWYRAYRNITAEREARTTESELRCRLADLAVRAGEQIVLSDR